MKKAWRVLGIAPTDDIKAIKKAYAGRLRECHPEDHPEEFQELRQAYEEILEELKRAAARPFRPSAADYADGTGRDNRDEGTEYDGGAEYDSDQDYDSEAYDAEDYDDGEETGEETGEQSEYYRTIALADQFMDRVNSIYNDYFQRIDLRAWQALFEDEQYWAVEVRRITRTGMIYFVSGDIQLPHEIWHYLDRQLMLLEQYDDLERHCSDQTIKRLTAQITVKNELRYDIFVPDSNGPDVGLYVSHRDNAFFSLAHNDLEEAEFRLDTAYGLYHGDDDLQRLRALYLLKKWDAGQAYKIFQDYDGGEFEQQALDQQAFERLKAYLLEYDQIALNSMEQDIAGVIIMNKLLSLLRSGPISASRGKVHELLDYSDLMTRYIDRQQIIKALYAAGNYQDTVEFCDEFLRTDPENEHVLIDKAQSLHYLERYAEALACYDRILELVPDHPDVASLWYNKGVMLLRLKRPAEALIFLDQALACNEQSSEYWAKKGEALFRLDRFQQAVDCLDTALELNSEHAMSWNFRALALHELERHEEALSSFDQAVAVNPAFDGAWHEKGNALYHLNRYEEAVECYDQAIALDPNENTYRINKGIVLDCMKQYEEALTCFDAALAINPLHGRTWNLKGETLVNQKRHEEALVLFDQAIAIDNGKRRYWENKANALKSLRRYKEALECFDLVLAIEPEYARGWYLKGLTLEQLEKYEEALSCLDRAIGLKRSLAYLERKGSLLHDIERYAEAVECYDLGLEIDPENRYLLLNKGLALILLERYEESLACCEKGISLYKDEGRFWSHKARIFNQLGQDDQAVACYVRALELDPRNAINWNNKGIIDLRAKRYEEALHCFEQAAAHDKNNYIVFFRTNIGNALHMLKRFDEAIACYDEVLKQNPEHGRAWSGKGEVFLELGKYRAAIDCCDQAIRIDAKNHEAWEYKGKALQGLQREDEARECLEQAELLKSQS